MKSSALLLCAAALLAGGCETTSLTPNVPSENIAVTFDHPDKFTDVRERFGDNTSETYLDIIREHVKATAVLYLAKGQKLEVTFTDIDLAGDFLPGRGSMDEVRIVKEIYIPRMTLSFRLLDAQGAVVKSGDRQLRNMNFLNEINAIARHEPLSYDKELLTRWVKDEFKG